MTNIFYVYEHWRTDRNECFYVGKGKSKRAYDLSNRNRYHKAVVFKVIREGFAIEIKIVASGLDEQTALEIEIERIKFWKENQVELANLSLGGGGPSGCKFSKETREKMSKARIGTTLKDETRRKMSAVRKGIKLSDETKAKIS